MNTRFGLILLHTNATPTYIVYERYEITSGKAQLVLVAKIKMIVSWVLIRENDQGIRLTKICHLASPFPLSAFST